MLRSRHDTVLAATGATGLAALLAACAGTGPRLGKDATMFYALRTSEHRGGDDLLTAGLGVERLRAVAAPAFADPARPTPLELRRRAIWGGGNYPLPASDAPVPHVKVDINRAKGCIGATGAASPTSCPAPASASGTAALPRLPGVEFHALAGVPGATQAHRVLVQVPDGFDRAKRCLLVAAASGSRGIYGAIAVAGSWGLPKGCAVACTDKGAGSDYYDLDAMAWPSTEWSRPRTDRWRSRRRRPRAPASPSSTRIRATTAEADWGRLVQQAARFGLQALDNAFGWRRSPSP